MGEIRFVGTGETRGYPYLVCKKCQVDHQTIGKFSFYPIALRKAKISYNFGLSGCNRVKQ